MQIVRDLAGYSMGRSDLVRRAMSKKKYEVMEQERKNFIHGIVDEDGKVQVLGCIRNGIKQDAANKIFDLMMDFASYAFNKSHAAAYAVVGYQTAYLMYYYPTEFTAAMLNSVKGDNAKVAYYIRFAKDVGIEILPPDINESFTDFTVQKGNIRFGMSAIKNVGINVVNSIVNSRNTKEKFKDFVDFVSKVDLSCVNKRAVDSLIKCGAFDGFGVYRSRLLAVYEKVLESVSRNQKKNIKGQMSLFDTLEDAGADLNIVYPKINEFDKKYILAMEKEMTGLYISGHPLDEYGESLKVFTDTKTSDIIVEQDIEEDISIQQNELKVRDGERVVLGGIISIVNKKVTRSNTMMAFITLEDLYGNIEVIVFPKILDRFKNLINEDELVIVRGRVSIREEEEPKIICDTIEPLTKINNDKIYILVEENNNVKSALKVVKDLSKQYAGNIPVYVCTSKERKKYRLERDAWLNEDFGVIEKLTNIFGDSNVKKQS